MWAPVGVQTPEKFARTHSHFSRNFQQGHSRKTGAESTAGEASPGGDPGDKEIGAAAGQESLLAQEQPKIQEKRSLLPQGGEARLLRKFQSPAPVKGHMGLPKTEAWLEQQKAPLPLPLGCYEG